MKNPVLFALVLAGFALHTLPAHALSEEQIDAQERAAREAKLKAVGQKIKHDAKAAGHAIKRDAEIVDSRIDAAFHKLEKATVRAAENVADAIRTIQVAAVEEAEHFGHHVHNGFAKMQRHLDVVRRGDSVAIAYCNSSLFKGPAKVGLGRGEDCKVLANGMMRIADVKSCMNTDRELPGAQPLARQLKSMDRSLKIEHAYFLTYDAEPSDIQALLGRCQARIARAAAKKRVIASPKNELPPPVVVAPPPAQDAKPEFKPVDHSHDQPVQQLNGTLE